MLLLYLVFLFHGVRAAYEEKLTLRPLEDINQVLARFEFVVDEAFDLDDGASLFPNVLRQLLEKYDVKSLHLTFSVGRYADWRYGMALDLNYTGLAHAPFGARLQVALIGDADVQQRWRGITSEMSGIFSASLNEMDETVVTRLLSSSIPQELDKSAIHMADSRSVVITDLRKEAVLFPSLWADGGNTSLRDSHKTQQDVVSVHRFFTGYGQVRGGIVVQLKNNHPSCMMRVTYHDVIPWYLRVYFHTFRVTASGGKKAEEMLRAFDFVPAELRGRPNQLRLEAFVPANSTLIFSLQMEKVFLSYSEHPPDANRGFDIASGVATFNIQRDSMEQSTCCELVRSPGFTTTLFTEPLLVLLPTPDFSMPYNVITMTSTVVAFLVGTTLNTLLRKAPRLKQIMTTQRNNDI
ncbi:hypothetical protein PsorP6_000189 [Peronosclerospora sorghi]|uniref:Uncharacterized protein n=1 Tax=Peronosclerospora sorghi TaxID=230839 RepID=A0ACC0WRF2_9STRA|nr:hypothetical protein PsorP6_000189 [Peronosclerospora sorghi]